MLLPHSKLPPTLAAVALVAPGFFLQTAARAQNADAGYAAYNAAFLQQANGQTYYTYGLSSATTIVDREWEQGLDVAVAEDRYEYTHAQGDRNLVISLLNSLASINSSSGAYGNWQTDGWDDNIAWMVNAFLRGYQLTGIANYLTEAEAGWNNGYNQGWDTSSFGGGLWENTGDKTGSGKCSLSNNPYVWEGIGIYLATGNGTYLSKAETIYSWERSTLFNTSTGQVHGCIHSTGLDTSSNVYDSGSFLNAALELYRVTGQQSYFNDAQLTASYVVNNGDGQGAVLHDAGEDSSNQWAYFFTRGLSRFATEANLWGKYQSYLQNNAHSAWSKRNNLNITWNDWTNTTNDSTPYPLPMSSAAAVWQQQLPPSVSLSGTYEIQSVASGLAVNVTGASTANGASIVQHPFTGGAANALWTFVPTSGGYYEIKNVNSGQAINVTAASGQQGALIVQWPGSAAGSVPGNDQWLPVQNPDGTYSFYNLLSYQALDIPNGSTTDGQQLDQWFGNSTNAQKFNLIAQ